MTIQYFFDVPVYRLRESKYSEGLDQYINYHTFDNPSLNRQLMEQFYKENRAVEIHARNHFWKEYGGAWQFNEIIGYIRLHFLGKQIRGKLWMADAKKVVKTRRSVLFIKHTR